MEEFTDFLIDRIKQDDFYLSNESQWVRSSKDLMLKVLSGLESSDCEFFLNYLYENLTSDKEMVLACVDKNGYNLQYASEDLKNDHQVVYRALQNRSDSFGIGENLKVEIGSTDPLTYLENYFLKEKLEKNSPTNKLEIPAQKMKL